MTRAVASSSSRSSSSSDNLHVVGVGFSPHMDHCCQCSALGVAGVLWILASALATALSCVGFYFPFWIEGSMKNSTPTYLGLWRRCNYLRASSHHTIEVVYECGRYSTFMDIPSLWWQIGTITIGVGCGLMLAVTMLGLFGCCCIGVITHRTARVCAHVQMLAGILQGAGLALYPLGWKSTEFRLVCGPHANIYHEGNCHFLWAWWAAIGAAGAALLCAIIGCQVLPKVAPVKFSSHNCRSRTARHEPRASTSRGGCRSRDEYMQVETEFT